MELRKKPKRQDDAEAEELKNQDEFETAKCLLSDRILDGGPMEVVRGNG